MFQKAVPVWSQGQAETMNSQIVLRGVLVNLSGCEIRIAASGFYRISVNGEFVAFGPARAAGGYARVDRMDLSGYHKETGENEIVIEVAGYYCRSLSTVKEKNFVAAEIRKEGRVIWATGDDCDENAAGEMQQVVRVTGYRSCRRLQKAERYSMQRHFGEIWDEREPDFFAEKFRVDLCPVEVQVTFIPRRVPVPNYNVTCLGTCRSRGSFVFDETLPYRENRYTCSYENMWDRYDVEEVEYLPFRWLQRQELRREKETCPLPLALKENEYALFDFGMLQAGFLKWSLEASEESEVVIGYSEMCFEKEFEYTKMNAQNVLQILLPAGEEKQGQSFEPYTFRFCIVMVKKGHVRINHFGVRNYIRDMSDIAEYEVRDPKLKEIYDAAIRTFAHNAVDLFMDCPSRERGGWLCDSFFTGRAEYFLFGKTPIEDAFLENFRLFRNPGNYPEGVLPMVYPADPQGEQATFIPQWNMWYVLEVAEYLTLRNPSEDKELFRESVMGIIRFLEKYENEDGLLQRLPSWNFIEWSTANEWGWDINYPTNFLYAGVLKAAGQLYHMPELLEKARKVREMTVKSSFDGMYFVDHAMLDENGTGRNLADTSEAGQYYALLFGELDLQDPKYKEFMENVRGGFKNRTDDGRIFVPVNAFIGFYLRICALMQLGEKQILAEDIKAFFGGMAGSTGTLWEYKEHKGSYDHGFASMAALAIVFAEN